MQGKGLEGLNEWILIFLKILSNNVVVVFTLLSSQILQFKKNE